LEKVPVMAWMMTITKEYQALHKPLQEQNALA